MGTSVTQWKTWSLLTQNRMLRKVLWRHFAWIIFIKSSLLNKFLSESHHQFSIICLWSNSPSQFATETPLSPIPYKTLFLPGARARPPVHRDWLINSHLRSLHCLIIRAINVFELIRRSRIVPGPDMFPGHKTPGALFPNHWGTLGHNAPALTGNCGARHRRVTRFIRPRSSSLRLIVLCRVIHYNSLRAEKDFLKNCWKFENCNNLVASHKADNTS